MQILNRVIIGIVVIGGLIIVLLTVLGFGQNFLFTQESWQLKNSSNEGILHERISANSLSGQFQNSPLHFINIDAPVPQSPSSVALFYGILSDADIKNRILFQSPNREITKNSTPSESEAQEYAESALNKFGGLPADAVYSGAFVHTAYKQKSSGEITARYPKSTQVYYNREIDGMPVLGENYDEIYLELGENGELLYYEKIWRTLQKTEKKAAVIPLTRAVEKLKKGDTVGNYQLSKDVFIHKIRLGYYEIGGTTLEELYPKKVLLEPCWVFYGKDPQSQAKIKFYIYARQFAGFSQTPATTKKLVAGKSIEEKEPFTATFTDTSDANPTKWQWDFGDGTTSTDKNPTHTYKTAGTYNVTLNVWNDLGSDSMTQQYTVDGAPGKIAEVIELVTTDEILSHQNETVATVTSTPAATALVTGNATAILTTIITVNATTITTGPTALLNVTPSTTTGNST